MDDNELYERGLKLRVDMFGREAVDKRITCPHQGRAEERLYGGANSRSLAALNHVLWYPGRQRSAPRCCRCAARGTTLTAAYGGGSVSKFGTGRSRISYTRA